MREASQGVIYFIAGLELIILPYTFSYYII